METQTPVAPLSEAALELLSHKRSTLRRPGSLKGWASTVVLTGAVWVTALVLPGSISFLRLHRLHGPGKSIFQLWDGNWAQLTG